MTGLTILCGLAGTAFGIKRTINNFLLLLLIILSATEVHALFTIIKLLKH